MFKKLRASPDLGQLHAVSNPCHDNVRYAVLKFSPPKHMFVMKGSLVSKNSSVPPVGRATVMPPVIRVATQIFPSASTASESKRRKPPSHVAS